MKRRSWTLVSLLSLCAIGGCATAPTPGRSSFLSSDAGLQTSSEKGDQERARPLAASDLDALRCFVIAEPVIYDKRLSPAQARRLAQDLRLNVTKAVKAIRPVHDSDPECATVKTAVTSVTKSNVLENLVFGVAILPVLPSNGAVAFEAEVTAPQDGRSLAALQWAKSGSPFSIVDGLTEIGQARALTRDFGNRVGKLMMTKPDPAMKSDHP